MGPVLGLGGGGGGWRRRGASLGATAAGGQFCRVRNHPTALLFESVSPLPGVFSLLFLLIC